MNSPNRIKVWDIVIRVFHWSLVILFFAAYLSGEEEELLHVYAGYAVLALVLFRVLYGFIGTRHARFSDFVFGPKTVIGYLLSINRGKADYYIGHNPLGGWMVVALLVFLLAINWSGLELYASEGKGPLAEQTISIVSSAHANDHEKEGHEDEFWEEIHEVLAELTLLLVFVHIVGVLLASAIHQENLIKAMFTGYKKRPEKPEE